ncbi:hypothetical protein CDL15_Pgr020192 [Punica granatum]|uniref:Solute carrier family 40 member n=1 Tax=Punica granatum TaxID=22663 RepID=A0A218VRS4_PUNGR|nr:hypothetical protein CDL15_Pgr020192 [Punica granatum]
MPTVTISFSSPFAPALYASCVAGNLVEQLWNFAWPSAIALLHPSLLPVAIMGFFAKLAIIAGGPLVGKLMDSFPRLPAYNFLNTVQVNIMPLTSKETVQLYRNLFADSSASFRR